MGLNTTHGCWDGPYSMFNTFRYGLAHMIGISLDDYAGYRGSGNLDLTSIDHDLMPLFNHSDCDGVIPPEDAKKIADGLTDILMRLETTDEPYRGFSEEVKQFRSGCALAASKNETIEFK